MTKPCLFQNICHTLLGVMSCPSGAEGDMSVGVMSAPHNELSRKPLEIEKTGPNF